ncbi:FxSxx-COOH cyclophane-containing RiPP peptide [Streptomyces sp. NBC_00094]|uniref:FxSxx-COOH cyclophane-containing RiPP peptide n=1 Tax=Streptomyces sp. NBC_00094 TaxID=2903620 RepID=UPI00224D53BF|nr:FxSxx-COOH cyclophane-containing RiPP peptide [Streptomyces sp. NBC_00094]MCX5394364.1 FxSxx-COOH protein [Streptomyces sp. NBC_00094]
MSLPDLDGLPDLEGLPDLAALPDRAAIPDLAALPDLAGLSLEELLDAPNPVLARAARRVLDRLTAEEAPLAAYDSSAVPTDDPPV